MQETVRAAIAAHSYFAYTVTSGTPPVTTNRVEAVIADTGLVDATVEAALAARGFAIVVHPVEVEPDAEQGRQRFAGAASVLVTIGINPAINPTGANRNDIAAAMAAMGAVARIPLTPGEQPWTFGESNLSFGVADNGLLIRVVHVSKKFTLNL